MIRFVGVKTYLLQALGKVGRVVHLYKDGDVKVQVGGGCWIFNPLAVTKVDQAHNVQDGKNTDVPFHALLLGSPSIHELYRWMILVFSLSVDWWSSLFCYFIAGFPLRNFSCLLALSSIFSTFGFSFGSTNTPDERNRTDFNRLFYV